MLRFCLVYRYNSKALSKVVEMDVVAEPACSGTSVLCTLGTATNVRDGNPACGCSRYSNKGDEFTNSRSLISRRQGEAPPKA